MKIKFIPLFILFLQCSSAADTEISKEDRNFAIKELKDSRDNFLEIMSSLNEEQLNYRTGETSWSIAQCLDHITMIENEVVEILQESLELPADPERRENLSFTDEELITHVLDPTKKTKTQQEFEPMGKFGNSSATMEAFKAKREEHIDYLKTTKDDLRNHFANFGSIDAYQIFLFMSSHTKRHINQIQEIKSDTNFPKIK